MRSAASHFLSGPLPFSSDSHHSAAAPPFPIDASASASASASARPSASSLFSPRPVLLAALLRSSARRISEAAVLLDGAPCSAVCFAGRVVRCEERPRRNGNAEAARRPFTAMLITDTTGLVPVMQFHEQRDGIAHNESDGEEEIYENDYVCVVGRIAFADTAREFHSVIKAASDFIATGSCSGGNNASGAAISACADTKAAAESMDRAAARVGLCVRGQARLITDMNEINYWTLSALETRARLQKLGTATLK